MTTRLTASPHSIANLVRERIEQGGERLWRFEDFRDQPFMAVAQTLSRLTKEGMITRISKGTYYRSRTTVFGQSRPNPAAIQQLASRTKRFFPSGITAANMLGFTTQITKQSELATNASSLPRKLVGQEAVIHTRRPEIWSQLTIKEAAILDFLREGGKTSELTPEDTLRKMLALLSADDCYQHLLNAASTEPPRVRALLGALGQQLGWEPGHLEELRQSLNPLSKFDFGIFSGLLYAKEWQAKE